MLKQTTIVILLVISALVVRGEKRSQSKPLGSRAAVQSRYEQTIKPLLNEYCFNCHGGGKKKGDVVLDQWTGEAEATRDSATWQRVLKVIQEREMPPENKPQPSPAQRAQLAKWIETSVFQCDCAHPDPGRVPIRRLNRAEYNNTIRDLLGVDFKPGDDFPVDDSGHGFDNMADALSLSPVLIEKYLAAAEKIVNTAFVLNTPTRPITKHFPVDALEVGYNARQRGDGWVRLNSVEEDDVALDFHAPAAGEFAVRVRAYATQASSNTIKLTFMLGDIPIETVVAATNAVMPRTYEARFKLAPGINRVRAAVRRAKDGLSETEALKWKSGPLQAGAVFLESLEVEGPLAVASTLPVTHRQVFKTYSQIGTDREVARDILGRFAARAYRRPVKPDEVNRLIELARESWNRGETFEQGVARAVQATLVSPHFLFRSSVGL